MYMNNSKKNVNVFHKDTKSHGTTEERPLLSERERVGSESILKAELSRTKYLPVHFVLIPF